MIDAIAVGKGFNVKGKSAKLNALSGFVPFLQISDNSHKEVVEPSPPDSRVTIYFRSRWACKLAHQHLLECVNSKYSDITPPREIFFDDTYANATISNRQVHGLDLREAVLREVYIMQSDLSSRAGWDTGRPSEPAFMNMNLHAVRGDSVPKVVLYQFDQLDPLNPQGLLIAYAEEFVLPVVSDIDIFTVGTKGQQRESLDQAQLNIAMHMLDSVEMILQSPRPDIGWNSRWLQVLQMWEDEGYHPEVPQYGFGDPASIALVEGIVYHTRSCGAVRHAPECFNLTFPQDFDKEYLIIWDAFDVAYRWKRVDEPGLREFLSHRL